MPIIAIVLVLSIAIGGGVSFVADRSMPTDPLWPFKTEVNDKLRITLTNEGQERAAMHLSLVKMRLEEAEKLNANDTLTPTLITTLEEKLVVHMNDFADEVHKVQASKAYEDAAALATELQATLAVHSSEPVLPSLPMLLEQSSALSAEAFLTIRATQQQ